MKNPSKNIGRKGKPKKSLQRKPMEKRPLGVKGKRDNKEGSRPNAGVESFTVSEKRTVAIITMNGGVRSSCKSNQEGGS